MTADRIAAAITSSLTQEVPSASAASLAVLTASAAVKQPAVFGSTLMPRSARTSSTDPGEEGSTRRIATVVSSVPEAVSARPRMSRLGAPPVPMISRDANFCPPSTSGSSASHSLTSASPERAARSGWPTSASLNGHEHLDLVPRRQPGRWPGCAAHHLAVDRCGDSGGGLRDQRNCPLQRRFVGHLMRSPVDHYLHGSSCRAKRCALKGAPAWPIIPVPL